MKKPTPKQTAIIAGTLLGFLILLLIWLQIPNKEERMALELYDLQMQELQLKTQWADLNAERQALWDQLTNTMLEVQFHADDIREQQNLLKEKLFQ